MTLNQAAAMAPNPRIGRYRWVICGLLFAATAINYVDRQILGVLKPVLQPEFGWSELTYGDIVIWFQFAYAVGYLGFGAAIDRIGARLGYAFAVALWTIAHVGHAFVSTITGFAIMRIGLGLGESGTFPASLKAVSEWFPQQERAFATGLFNAGTNIGAIITPLIVPAITIAFGWRWAFIITGSFSLIWLVVWLVVYRRPRETKALGAAELAFIESGQPATKVVTLPWARVMRTREAWAYALGKFLIDPIWWMYLFWLPDFFVKTYHLDLKTFGPPLVAVYVLSDLGSIAGGWLSSSLIKHGTSVNAARKIAMLVCALAVVPIMFAMYANNLWLAVGIVGLAAAGHQGFSANLYTLPSDLFPQGAVASVVGFGGMLGAVGGILMTRYTSVVLENLGTYTPIFIVAGSVYLIALLVVHILSLRLQPVTSL